MSASRSSKQKSAANLLTDGQLIISVKEARKLLGKDFKSFTDKQIEDMIVKLDLIAKGFISQSISI